MRHNTALTRGAYWAEAQAIPEAVPQGSTGQQALMAAYGARVALHLAQLTVRRSRRGLRFFGVAAETPEHWLPPTGLSRTTIREGMRELQAGVSQETVVHVRRPGGGRKSLEQHDPELKEALER